MCRIVPEKRGVVFRTKGPAEVLQYVFRIPLPHMGRQGTFLCAALRYRTAEYTEGRYHYVQLQASIFCRLLAHRCPRGERSRKLTFAALMIAMCLVLSAVPSVPLFGGAKVTWGYLARATCALVCGPVLGVVFGLAEDLLSFILTGGGGYPFFPGYTLTTMLGVLLYALFFYRARLTVRRIFWAKLFTNVLNVTLGALWMAILSGKAWYVTAGGSAIKNLIMLPVQTLLLVMLFTALLPALRRAGLVPDQGEKRNPW